MKRKGNINNMYYQEMKDEVIKGEVTKLMDKSGYCIKIYVKNDNEDGYRIQPLEKIGA